MIPWRRKWQPTPVFLPGKFHGQRSLAGYSPWGSKESDKWMTEDSTGVVKERHHWTSAHHGLSSSIDGQMLITALIFDGKKSSRLHVTCPKSQLLSSKARLYLDLHFSPFVKMAYDLQIPHVNTPYQGFQNSWMHLLFCQLIFLVFWPYYAACCILVPAPWIEPVPPTVEVQSPNRWTAREIPIKKKISFAPSQWSLFCGGWVGCGNGDGGGDQVTDGFSVCENLWCLLNYFPFPSCLML